MLLCVLCDVIHPSSSARAVLGEAENLSGEVGLGYKKKLRR